jgi:zinc D-Ala-D-Ala carboxypeptidase
VISEPVAAVQTRIAEIRAMMNAATATQSTTQSPTQPSAGGAVGAAGSDFASVLAQVSQADAPDLSKYPNGKIPEHLLTSIGGNERLAANAAQAFTEMRAAATAAGINLPVNDSYRSYDEQVEMARTKGLYSQGGLAAAPGTSTHGLGMSVDLELNPTTLSWMQTNAGKYGFKNDVPGESWHWTYKP